jgi:ribonuclease kappa
MDDFPFLRLPSTTRIPLLTIAMIRNSTVISVFAIVILSVLGLLFNNNHHELVGGDEDPENGPQVAATVFLAVAVYSVRTNSLSRPWKVSWIGKVGSMVYDL